MITHQISQPHLFQDNKLTSNDSPFQNISTTSDTFKLTRLLKPILPPRPHNMEIITTLILKVVMVLCLLGNSSVAASSIALNSFPTTEFTPTQFHIQTDDGENRFFKYQTWSGQFRKETRLDDGAIVGSYGWVDANGMLRVTEYRADKSGYRITKNAMYNVGQQQEKTESSEDKLNFIHKNNKKFNRKKSSFLRTSQQHKVSRLTKSPEIESEISNDIFSDEDNFRISPTQITSTRPVVVSLKRRGKTTPAQKLRRKPLLPFIKRRLPQNRRNNFGSRNKLELEREQNEITDVQDASRLQRRISTPDGRTETINVEPIFDDEGLFSNELEDVETNSIIDNGDDILILPSQKKPDGRVIINTPHRRRKLFTSFDKSKGNVDNVRGRLGFNSIRSRQERKLRRRPNKFTGEGAFIVKRRRRPINRGGRIPMTRQKDSVLENNSETEDQNGKLSVNYATSNTFHHENEYENGERRGQYGYIDPIGVRRVVTYTTGSRGSSRKGQSEGIKKTKENDYYGTNTYFKAN